MKSLPVTAVLAFLIIGMMTSGTIHEDLRHPNSPTLSRGQIVQDTTTLMNLLRVDSFFLPVVQPASGVQFFKNGIVFLSNTKNETRMLPSHVSFGTTQAYFTVPRDFTSGEHKLFSPSESFPYPSDGITFSSDLKTMYFTKLYGKPSREKIFMAKQIPGDGGQPGWEPEKEPLEFCDENFSYSHPALSSDDKIMIFASNQQGTLGGMDLFITRKVNGKWSVPQNPGKIINTSGNEFFPFLDKDNNLFFSSDKLKGFGGFDIFVCRFNGYDWEKPKNLSEKINTKDDEIAFTLSREDGQKGFFTRRNPAKKDEMQLFRLAMNTPTAADRIQLFAVTDGNEKSKDNLITISSVFVNKPMPKVVAATQADKTKTTEPKEEIKIIAQPAAPTTTQPSAPSVKTPAAQPGAGDKIVFRVQFLASMKPKGKFRVTVNNQSYETYEYFYLGAYRYCIGEFATVAPARNLQNAARLSGQNQAFVVAFKNNERTLDMSLFK
jgi:hypothetical protein